MIRYPFGDFYRHVGCKLTVTLRTILDFYHPVATKQCNGILVISSIPILDPLSIPENPLSFWKALQESYFFRRASLDINVVWPQARQKL
jgi:hypothetical protein